MTIGLLAASCSEEETGFIENPYPSVTNLTAEIGDTEVTLSWDAPVDASPTDYIVYYDNTSGVTQSVHSYGEQTCIVDNLINFNEYTFSVQALYGSHLSNLVQVSATPVGRYPYYYLDEDFEFMEPYSIQYGAPDPVVDGSDSIIKISDCGDLNDQFTDRGFEFVTAGSTNTFYICRNYIRFNGGVATSTNHSGIKLPLMDDIPEGTDITLVFDWCPFKISGSFDNVTLAICVGDTEIAEIGHNLTNNDSMQWINESVDINNYTPSEDNRITIRTAVWGVNAGYCVRWFIDNIQVYVLVDP